MSESGKFYSTFIDPILRSMRKRVVNEIQPGQSVIDIACGTGAQVIEIAKKAKQVVGVDLSESMIQYARKAAKKHDTSNTDFFVCDATNLSPLGNKNFDIAILSLALHQFSSKLYSPILSEMKKVADKIIIVDYAIPLPINPTGIASRIIEFFAGKEHNQNFKSYYKLGGLNDILKKNELSIEKTELFAKGAFQLVVCTPV